MLDRKPMIAGNWKMNLNEGEARELVRKLGEGIRGYDGVDVLVAPPFTLLAAVREAMAGSGIFLAAQNMHWELKGAFTGEVSARMLQEAGCTHVILGHSERRSLFGESDEVVDLKAKTAALLGLVPIICVGESLAEREEGKTTEVIQRQLDGSLRNFTADAKLPVSTILAYEPVWAIGTGKTATPGQAQEVHAFIRSWVEKHFNTGTAEQVRILYGGSVKAGNAAELMAEADIDGALVGGASLTAEAFLGIIRYRG
jgi:triosephosphate isomerase (TIM)